MPFKLIYFLFIALCFGLFAGFNLNNSSDVCLIFHTLKDIPIYISNLFSFLIGVVLIVPFFAGNKRKKKEKEEKKKRKLEQEAAGVKTVDLKSPKKKYFWNRKKKDSDKTNTNSENKTE